LCRKNLCDLKVEQDKEKVAWEMNQIEVDTLTWAVKDLKITTDRFASQILTLEDNIKHLESKVVDGLNEVRAKELSLECTTMVSEDYKKKNA
jgi:hypothetical protein